MTERTLLVIDDAPDVAALLSGELAMPVRWMKRGEIAGYYGESITDKPTTIRVDYGTEPKEKPMQRGTNALIALAIMGALGASAMPGGRGIPGDDDRPLPTEEELKAMEEQAEATKQERIAAAQAKRARKNARRLARAGIGKVTPDAD